VLPIASNGYLYGEIAPVFDIALDVKEYVATPATASTATPGSGTNSKEGGN